LLGDLSSVCVISADHHCCYHSDREAQNRAERGNPVFSDLRLRSNVLKDEIYMPPPKTAKPASQEAMIMIVSWLIDPLCATDTQRL
jgi:hypothetical protein